MQSGNCGDSRIDRQPSRNATPHRCRTGRQPFRIDRQPSRKRDTTLLQDRQPAIQNATHAVAGLAGSHPGMRHMLLQLGVFVNMNSHDAMMKSFIDHQNTGLVYDSVIPSSGSRCNQCVGERLNGFIMSMHINLFGCTLKNREIVAKTACVCIGIGFIGQFCARPWQQGCFG